MCSFNDWLISLSIMFSSCFHVVVCARVFFFFKAELHFLIPLYVWTIFYLSIHLLIDPWVASTFWLLWSSEGMKMNVQISVSIPAFNSFGYMPRSRSTGSYGNSIFKFLRNHHTVLIIFIYFWRAESLLCKSFLSLRQVGTTCSGG